MSERGSGAMRRFGAYFLGIAIGLVFLGIISSQRAKMRALQEAEDAREAEASTEAEGDSEVTGESAGVDASGVEDESTGDG